MVEFYLNSEICAVQSEKNSVHEFISFLYIYIYIYIFFEFHVLTSLKTTTQDSCTAAGFSFPEQMCGRIQGRYIWWKLGLGLCRSGVTFDLLTPIILAIRRSVEQRRPPADFHNPVLSMSHVWQKDPLELQSASKGHREGGQDDWGEGEERKRRERGMLNNKDDIIANNNSNFFHNLDKKKLLMNLNLISAFVLYQGLYKCLQVNNTINTLTLML